MHTSPWTSFAPYAGIVMVLALALLLSAAGCPGERASTPKPDGTSAGAQTSAAQTGASADTSGGADAKPDTTPASAPAGSLKVQDAGPPAPTIAFLAGLKGYIEPCGCTLDVMVGGLDRINGYLAKVKTFHEGHLVLDAGNMLFERPKLEAHEVAQEQAKVDVILKAQEAMGTVSTTPGPSDFALGKHFYLDKVRNSGIEILAANLQESEGVPLGPPHVIHDLKDYKLGVIGLVDPNLFEGVEGLKVSDPIKAAKRSVAELVKAKVQAIVVVYHAELGPSKALMEQVPEVNFVIVGHSPRETDAADPGANGAYALEAYDQGRYMGLLKLYPRGATAPVAQYANGRQGSKKEKDRIERRIASIKAQIEQLPPATPGNEPPILKRLRADQDRLERELVDLSVSAVKLPESGPAFVYRAVPLEPGYPEDPALRDAITGFKKTLYAITEPAPILPVPKGQAEYVGTERCEGCHLEAHNFWKTTAHSHAIDTLVKRNSVNDAKCVGCHVTGYQKPGGSNLKNLEYAVNINGAGFTKKLQNVGCEVCHGPGSKHIGAPLGKDGKPQNITRQVPETVCTECHNSEHSPRFNYPVYLKSITGEGHPLKSATP